LLSTMVHFLVVASRTTKNSAALAVWATTIDATKAPAIRYLFKTSSSFNRDAKNRTPAEYKSSYCRPAAQLHLQRPLVSDFSNVLRRARALLREEGFAGTSIGSSDCSSGLRKARPAQCGHGPSESCREPTNQAIPRGRGGSR
jgi:hypothetical protein